MIYLMCGRICSGKSTHSQSLRKEKKAVVLSVDEITLALFGQDAGEKHDDHVAAAEEYLYRKSLEIAENGIDVILDWGFWTKEERDYAREFYGSRNIPFEFHYIDITADEWQKRIDKRNADITSGRLQAYYVDDGLAKKFAEIFEKPDESEMKDFIIV